VSKFRKKPVVIEARQYDGDHHNAILDWVNSEGGKAKFHPYVPAVRSSAGFVTEGAFPACISICTLEGDMFANEGDWIIRGVAGEFYPCKPDIFVETYEAVRE
jgi:hypothetical protein